MADRTSNDGISAGDQPQSPDAHGQAAMLLVESLIHGLIARSVISVSDAVEIVNIATDVKEESAVDLGASPTPPDPSLAILTAIRSSLEFDLPEEEP